LNLLINPLQILPKGSEIVVRTVSADASLIIEVDDNGPGIPEEHRQRVFDPFFTQRDGGIGLGLTVVQQIVKAHGAEIAADASPAGGARFRISFPQREMS
ncbi:MAG: sensor histidine kinase, partial [Proteobacteria bacterium]|nr:sensor histidine kinase [Pseudomonadota bacterium]